MTIIKLGSGMRPTKQVAFAGRGALIRGGTLPIEPVHTPYRAPAVQFDGTERLINAALSATNGPGVISAIWLKSPDTSGFPIVWVVDPEDQYLSWAGYSALTDFRSVFRNVDDVSEVSPGLTIPEDAWFSYISSSQSSGAAAHIASYKDDTLGGTPIITGSSPFSPLFDGLPFWIGGDSFSGDELIAAAANLQIWVGQTICEDDDTITEAHRRLFVSADGKPVDPAMAEAVLGPPTVRFSTLVAWQSGINEGTGGPFALTGLLPEASDSPSD